MLYFSLVEAGGVVSQGAEEEIVDRQGVRQQVPLNQADPEVDQDGQFGLVLHALGHDGHPEAVGERDDRLRDHPGVGLDEQGPGVAVVELEPVDRVAA